MKCCMKCNLVLKSEMMEGLREKFWQWKEAFKSKGLKVNLGKTKVLMSGAESEVSVSKVGPCVICGKQVMANSVLCVKYNYSNCNVASVVVPDGVVVSTPD